MFRCTDHAFRLIRFREAQIDPLGMLAKRRSDILPGLEVEAVGFAFCTESN